MEVRHLGALFGLGAFDKNDGWVSLARRVSELMLKRWEKGVRLDRLCLAQNMVSHTGGYERC